MVTACSLISQPALESGLLRAMAGRAVMHGHAGPAYEPRRADQIFTLNPGGACSNLKRTGAVGVRAPPQLQTQGWQKTGSLRHQAECHTVDL